MVTWIINITLTITAEITGQKGKVRGLKGGDWTGGAERLKGERKAFGTKELYSYLHDPAQFKSVLFPQSKNCPVL